MNSCSVGVLSPDAAHAVRQIRKSDGTYTEAFQFDIPLRIVSLAGTVPSEWEQEFKQMLKGKALLKLERRPQLLDIFKELSKPQ